jgi:hypothetical protein
MQLRAHSHTRSCAHVPGPCMVPCAPAPTLVNCKDSGRFLSSQTPASVFSTVVVGFAIPLAIVRLNTSHGPPGLHGHACMMHACSPRTQKAILFMANVPRTHAPRAQPRRSESVLDAECRLRRGCGVLRRVLARDPNALLASLLDHDGRRAPAPRPCCSL